MGEARKPLISGNWKMNHNHFEAIQMVQKLSYALSRNDYDVVDVSVHPPFTDLRSIQTVLESDDIPIALGAQNCQLTDGSLIRSIYKTDTIFERHRHRYEVNAGYRERLEKGGLIFSGMSPDGTLPEIVERPDHPWFVGVQFHPELKSKPFDPHPLFASFIEAAVKQSRLV